MFFQVSSFKRSPEGLKTEIERLPVTFSVPVFFSSVVMLKVSPGQYAFGGKEQSLSSMKIFILTFNGGGIVSFAAIVKASTIFRLERNNNRKRKTLTLSLRFDRDTKNIYGEMWK